MKRFFTGNKMITLLLIGVGVLLLPGEALAQVSDGNDSLKGFATITSLFINVFTFLSLAMIELAGDLFGTEWLIGEDVMETGIRPMWMVMRNIANILFVALLVIVSFTNLFTSGISGNAGEWSIKQKLPKIILGLIAINFSLLAFKWAIELVHVGTVSVLSLSDTTLEQKSASSVRDIMTQPYRYTVDNNIIVDDTCTPDTPGCTTFSAYMNDIFCPNYQGGVGDVGLDSPGCLFAINPDTEVSGSGQSSTIQNLIMAFAVHFQHIERLPTISAYLGSWTEVSQDVLFSTILAAAFTISLVMVFIALIFRMVVLWLGMVLSPLILGAKIMGIKAGGGGDQINFTKLLILPVTVAAVFSITFVLLSTMSDITLFGERETFVRPGRAIFSQGMFGFLWQITTLVIFWTGIKVATKTGTAAVDDLIGKFSGGASTLGSYLARRATIDNQIFTVTNSKGQSVPASASNLANLPEQAIIYGRNKQREEARQFYESMTGNIDSMARSMDNLSSAYGSNSNEANALLAKYAKTDAGYGAFQRGEMNEVLKAMQKSSKPLDQGAVSFLLKSENLGEGLTRQIFNNKIGLITGITGL